MLELMLAMGLAAVVLTILSAAIDFHLRVLGSGRRDVEQAQLARAILQNVASDLRSSVPYAPPDVASMMPSVSLPSGTSLEGVAVAGGDATGGTSGGAGSSIAQRSDDDTSLVSDVTVGLYGTSNWLQVDTSRLPRLDQFVESTTQVADSTLADRTSEVKTVAYFVAPPRGDGTPGGLVRRELDRAVTSWATQQGLVADVEEQIQPLAPEVAAIEFAYFDGTELVDYWDMDERNALPMAVQVVLYLRSEDPNQIDPLAYRLWVHLPTAEPSTLDDAEDESEEEQTGGQTGGSQSSSGTQNTGG
ncbi:MAG: hypothetical protein JW809_19055 [Pirellulales bacterium]|nr:hypothetical protein [Pirellulales bacterium]